MIKGGFNVEEIEEGYKITVTMDKSEHTKVYVCIGRLTHIEGDKETEVKKVVWLCGTNKKEAKNWIPMMEWRMENERNKILHPEKKKEHKNVSGLACLFND